MARDCFVYWDATQSVPTREELQQALEKYGDGIAEPRWDVRASRFFIHLPGFAKRVDEMKERYFEVHIGDKNIDVITREMDPITNAIAFGFAQQVSYKWKGRLEYG